MTEHKLTDEEVIKSLKVCLEGDNCKECYINPHHGNYGYCTSLALKAALDLINRQKAEIERLTTLAELGRMRANDYRAMRDKAKIARAEAIKEFAEGLKNYYRHLNGTTVAALVEYHIDQIAKEMLGGQD